MHESHLRSLLEDPNACILPIFFFLFSFRNLAPWVSEQVDTFCLEKCYPDRASLTKLLDVSKVHMHAVFSCYLKEPVS